MKNERLLKIESIIKNREVVASDELIKSWFAEKEDYLNYQNSLMKCDNIDEVYEMVSDKCFKVSSIEKPLIYMYVPVSVIKTDKEKKEEAKRVKNYMNYLELNNNSSLKKELAKFLRENGVKATANENIKFTLLPKFEELDKVEEYNNIVAKYN